MKTLKFIPIIAVLAVLVFPFAAIADSHEGQSPAAGIMEPMNASVPEEEVTASPAMTPSAALATATTANNAAVAQTESAKPMSDIETKKEASEHIAFLRGAVDAFTSSKNKDKDYARNLTGELDSYLLTYRSIKGAEEAILLRSQIYGHLGQNEAELISLMKLVYEFPNSSFKDKAAEQIKSLFVSSLKKDWRSDIDIDKALPATIADRLIVMLDTISLLDRKDFLPLRIQEYDQFLSRFPRHPKADLVLTYRANALIELKEYQSAGYTYQRLISLYPSSPLRADTLYALGDLLEDKLREYDKAVEMYGMVVEQYPQSPKVISSYQKSAVLYDKKLKQYEKAVECNEAIISKFPGTNSAREAFLYLADLHYDEKYYEKTIDAYSRLADMFKGQYAIKALQDAAKVAGSRLREYNNQISLLERIYMEYKESEEAVESLYEIAEIYDDRIKDVDKAMSYYKKVYDEYPGSKYGAKAIKRIEKLQKP